MKTVLVTDPGMSQRTRDWGIGKDDLERIARAYLGEDTQVVYEYNIPRCGQKIREGVDVLVIPTGHGDWNVLSHLQRDLEVPDAPAVLPLYQLEGGRGHNREFYDTFTAGRTKSILEGMETWFESVAAKAA